MSINCTASLTTRPPLTPCLRVAASQVWEARGVSDQPAAGGQRQLSVILILLQAVNILQLEIFLLIQAKRRVFSVNKQNTL